VRGFEKRETCFAGRVTGGGGSEFDISVAAIDLIVKNEMIDHSVHYG
jgi:hypothetical protein